ncbi:hypothetical protein TNIN_135021 [Trichonephila inaurata madagascariensis]|uniref:Uncharacterized protein n=1 Tax=Trichonephila inaurata madagascariensis TaxID=2747483 RepID=A0A8X6XY42_9ARAC|nr:hypothetical protein TNIN_135021 [Trichonephila inaurata madagascariensis]
MTQRSKLVTPDVVFNLLNAELSSLATSFATSLNVGFALGKKIRASARRVSNLTQHDALARKDALRPCVSHTSPPTTPRREKHLPPLQSPQPIEGTLDTVGYLCTQHFTTLLSQNTIARNTLQLSKKNIYGAQVETHSLLILPCHLLGSRLIQTSYRPFLNPYQSNRRIRSHFRVLYKSRAQKPVASFYSRDIEDEKALALNLAVYQGTDLGDYINFMVQFQSSLNALKPADVIALEPIYTVDLVEQMQQLLPNLNPRQIPTFESFAYFEPADVFEDLEQEASKGKGALFPKPCGV